MEKIKDVVKSAIFGTVVGDALGVPVEFSARADRDVDPVMGMREFGTHYQPAGTWSDDSSMMLATMDSMILRKRFDPDDVMQRLADWLNKGDYTPHGNVFDIGITCSRAISAYLSGKDPLKCGGDGERDNGNGSLMRIMPASLVYGASELYWSDHLEEAVDLIHGASCMTHGHPRALIGCMIYTSLCHELIYGKEKGLENAVQDAVRGTLEFYDNAWEKYSWFDGEFDSEIQKDSYKRLRRISIFKALPRDEIQSSGYVVHTLEAAIWCLLNTNSFSECVLEAVNLGGDTDTTAAVAGGVAGIYYGYESIPDEWINVIAEKEWIDALCGDYSKWLETLIHFLIT